MTTRTRYFEQKTGIKMTQNEEVSHSEHYNFG